MKKPTNRFVTAKDRDRVLKEQRNLKMARSSQAYVRGSTLKFYEWLDSSQALALPQGPAIWICGDCHVGNMGPVANAKGNIEIQIRDFDQAVIGNPAHDLIRLGLSLISTARGSNLPGVIMAKMLEQIMEGYKQAFADNADPVSETAAMPESIALLMQHAIKRKWKHLAKERIEDVTPTIPLGKRFWPLSKSEKADIRILFNDEKIRRLVTSLRSRDDNASVEVIDAAYWVKGCSSLGSLRYAVLVGIDGKQGELCIMDIKEAVQALAPRNKTAKMPKDNAERVVQGAWHLAPALGDRMRAARFENHSVFLRELLPQDLKVEMEHIDREEAMKVSRFLASVLGKAHARQMDDMTRRKWLKELQVKPSKNIDAPSWLWSGVVELIMSHEGAYLEHCRKYAMESV